MDVSICLLSTLHAAETEHCVYVDPLPITQARESLHSVKKSGLHFINATSRALSPPMLRAGAVSGYRWIHIDGEHSRVAVEHDLALASTQLGERGIIVVDDFMAPEYPQITFAVIEYLHTPKVADDVSLRIQ